MSGDDTPRPVWAVLIGFIVVALAVGLVYLVFKFLVLLVIAAVCITVAWLLISLIARLAGADDF